MKFLIDQGIDINMFDNPLWSILVEDDQELDMLAKQNGICDCYDAKDKGLRILERYLKRLPVSSCETRFCKKILSIQLSEDQKNKAALLNATNFFNQVRMSIQGQLTKAREYYIEAVEGLRKKIKFKIGEINNLNTKRLTKSDKKFLSRILNLVNLSGIGATMQNLNGREESYGILAIEFVKLISEKDSIKTLSKFPELSANIISFIKISAQYDMILKTLYKG